MILLPFYGTRCEEFIHGIFILVLLEYLAEIVEKERYHRSILCIF